MIDIIMRYGNGELLRKAIAQGSIITARTSIPKELKPVNGVYPEAPVTLWLKKGDTTKLHATGTASFFDERKDCFKCDCDFPCRFERSAQLAGFDSEETWYDAFRSFHPRWKGGTVYFIEITEIKEVQNDAE